MQQLKVTVGRDAPDFAVKSLDGDSLKLSDLRGKFVMIDFWGSWCGPCRGEIPNFKKLYESVSRDTLEIIAIANDDSTDLVKYIQEQDIQYPNALAPKKVLSTYGVNAYPTTFLISPNGKIVAKNLRGGSIVELTREKIREYYLKQENQKHTSIS